jgi:hypothetical protein
MMELNVTRVSIRIFISFVKIMKNVIILNNGPFFILLYHHVQMHSMYKTIILHNT